MNLDDIKNEHFFGSPNISDKKVLLNSLGLTYNKPISSFNAALSTKSPP